MPLRFLRWFLDVVRGYIRAADGRDRALELLRGNELDPRYIGAFGDAVDTIAAAREERGPLGIGARIAVTRAEIGQLTLLQLGLGGGVSP